ncbi:MAG TPA: Sec-independent protein translocase protein TatB [Sphingomonas sp.]|nr:Sec-independent protein translocase protein TatB [Sphingomonas sp.]
MFDVAPSEMLIVALVAIVLIGPKDLPRVMRVLGQWVGRGRSVARHFRSAIDDMIREAELEEMEKKWKAENERIMREHADLLTGAPAPEPVVPPKPELPAPGESVDAAAAAPVSPAPAAPAEAPPRS